MRLFQCHSAERLQTTRILNMIIAIYSNEYGRLETESDLLFQRETCLYLSGRTKVEGAEREVASTVTVLTELVCKQADAESAVFFYARILETMHGALGLRKEQSTAAIACAWLKSLQLHRILISRCVEQNSRTVQGWACKSYARGVVVSDTWLLLQ